MRQKGDFFGPQCKSNSLICPLATAVSDFGGDVAKIMSMMMPNNFIRVRQSSDDVAIFSYSLLRSQEVRLVA